jgi:uncharacterized membrane protein YoaK (UPF0700 family)
VGQSNNRKHKKNEVPFFRPSRSISGTQRRVTTAELRDFEKELIDQPWVQGTPSWSEPPLQAPSTSKPPPADPRASRPSIPSLQTAWLSSPPSAPPPSPWVPAIESTPPAAAAPERAQRPQAKAQPVSNEAIRVGVLSGIAGYVDAAGFLTLFGLLPAHMTGDIVWAGAAAVDRANMGWLVRLSMVLMFVGSVAVAATAARVIRRRGQSPLASLLALMTIALGVFWASGAMLGPLISGPDGIATLFVSASGVFAMGIQNAIMREALGTLTPTTVMTGNLTQVTMDVVELVFASFDVAARRPHRRRKEALARLSRFGLPVASFTTAALAGAFATTSFGFSSLAVPTIASMALTAHSFRVAKR